MRKYQIYLLSIAFLASGTWVACRAEKPKTFNASPVDISYPEDEGFSLTGSADKQIILEGSLLVWKADPALDGMVAISQLSDKSMGLALDVNRYAQEHIPSLSQQFNDSKLRLLTTQREIGREFYELAFQKAALWLAGQDGTAGQLGLVSEELEKIDGKPLHEQEIQHAQKVLSVYCDAKLWQRAVHASLVQEKYLRRPTPAALCEGYYQQQGYFNDPVCQPVHDQQASSYKSYALCLWREGVMRTPLARWYFVKPEDQQVLSQLSEQEIIATFKDSNQGRNLLSMRGQLEVNKADLVEPYVVALQVAQVEDNPYAAFSPVEIIKYVELGSSKYKDLFRLLPQEFMVEHEGDPQPYRNDEEVKFLKKANSDLHKAIRSLLSMSPRHYVNETFFNEPFKAITVVNQDAMLHPSQQNLQEAHEIFPEIFAASSPRLEKLKQKDLPEAQKKLSDIASQAQDVLKALDSEGISPEVCQSQQNPSFACRELLLTREGVGLLTREDTTAAVWPMRIIFEIRDQAKTLVVRATINRVVTQDELVSCLPLEEGSTCDEQAYKNSWLKIVKFHPYPAGTQIQLEINLASYDRLGLGVHDRSLFKQDLYFSDIDWSPLVAASDVKLVIDGDLFKLDNLLWSYRGDMTVDSVITLNNVGSFRLRQVNSEPILMALKLSQDLKSLQKELAKLSTSSK